MPKSAASCSTPDRHCTDWKRREVIREQETFLSFAFEYFQALHIVASAQRRCHQGLRFTAREDSRAVGSRQDSHFDRDGTNLVEGAAIGPALLMNNLIAKDALAQNFVIILQLVLCRLIFFRQGRDQYFFQLFN